MFRICSTLREFDLRPVWCGPAVSRGRVFVGSGNRIFPAEWIPGLTRFQIPKSSEGSVTCFGLTQAAEIRAAGP